MILGAIALYFFVGFLVKIPGMNLQSKFTSLGDLQGKTMDEIVAVVGPPNALSGAPDGKTVCQWMATGFHIVLLFNDKVCEGITHQFTANVVSAVSSPTDGQSTEGEEDYSDDPEIEEWKKKMKEPLRKVDRR